MAQHRFVKGDAVVVHADPRETAVRPGLYFVLEQLPPEDVGPRYCVRSALDPHECIVDEAWLRSADKW